MDFPRLRQQWHTRHNRRVNESAASSKATAVLTGDKDMAGGDSGGEGAGRQSNPGDDDHDRRNKRAGAGVRVWSGSRITAVAEPFPA